jgi:hypothetical protein
MLIVYLLDLSKKRSTVKAIEARTPTTRRMKAKMSKPLASVLLLPKAICIMLSEKPSAS